MSAENAKVNTVKKRFLIWDYQKIEDWLNEMSAQGQHLVHVDVWSFSFKEGPPDLFQYRVAPLLRKPEHRRSETFRRYLEENQAKLIPSGAFAYCRKKTADGGLPPYPLVEKFRYFHFYSLMYWTLTLISFSPATMNLVRFFVRGFSVENGIQGGLWTLMSALYLCFAIKTERTIRKLVEEKP
ncbi:MAG: DUF2812 domain-containing protein [Clostridiales bacterium]|nr:DUF2812 domain-containing protein [Clostridiales bacterium]